MLMLSLMVSSAFVLWLSWRLHRACQADATRQQTINDAVMASSDRRDARRVCAGFLGVLLCITGAVYLGIRQSPGEQGNARTRADSGLPPTEETASAGPWRVGTPCPYTRGGRLNYDSSTNFWSCGRWVRVLNGPMNNSTNHFEEGDPCLLWHGYATRPVFDHEDAVLTRVVRNRLPGGSDAEGSLCPEGTLFLDVRLPAQEP